MPPAPRPDAPGRGPTRKVTARQVAELAGVSRSAVSLVFNDRADGYLSQDTQGRIRAAASELGYSPNLLARSLRNQRSGMIGMLSNQAVASPFDGEIYAGAAEVARAHGFTTFAADTEHDGDHGELASAALLDRGVDALIYLTVGLHETRVIDSFLSLPSALANCYPDAGSPAGSERLAWVIPAEVAGGRTAAEHLIGLGHRDIAFLGGNPDSPAALLREQGFREAMAAAGLEVRSEWVRVGGFQIGPGYRAAYGVLDAPAGRRPTAILAGNDRAAIGATFAANQLGLSVPDDLSIVGYDNERDLAATMVPPLTTMALPLLEMGRVAMRAVLSQVIGGDIDPVPGGEVLLPCPLVVRRSTAPRPV